KYQEKIAEVLRTGKYDEMDLVLPDSGEGVRYHNIRFVAERRADGAITGVQTIGRDISEHKRAEQERVAYLRFLESMDRVNRAIQGTNDLDQMMSDVLDMVLSTFDCDRAFLMYPCDPDALSWFSPMERTRPEYPGVLALGLSEVPMDAEVARTLRIMLNNDSPVKFGPGNPNPLPTDVSERFGFKTFMSMALYPKMDKPWQFGIHQCSYARIWTPEEERLFQAIGQRLADALASLLAHRNLRESEARYRQIFENTSDVLAISEVTEDGRFIWVDCNPAWEKITGIHSAIVIGRSIDEFIETDATSRIILDLYQECVEKRVPMDRELELVTPTGRWYVHTTFIPLENAAGRIYRIIAVSRNITERKHAEDALRESEEKYRLLHENAGVGIGYYKPDGEVISYNQLAASHMGGRPEDFKGKSIYEVFPREEADFYMERIRLSLAAESTLEYEDHVNLPSGEKWFLSVFTRICDARQNVIGVQIISQDITGLKRAEQERMAHLRFFESMDQVNRALQGSSNLEQRMSDVLDVMLSIFQSDRAWLVYPCDPDSLTWQVPVERTRPEYPSVLPMGVDLPLDPSGAEVFRILRASNGPVKFGPGSERPVPVEMAQGVQVQSFIAMAIYPKVGKPWSFGMHQCSFPREWTLDDERLVQEIGRRLSDALTSLLTYRNLKESEERYRLVFENSPVSIWEEDFSLVKAYFDQLRASGVTDFRAYFESHPEAVAHCAELIKVLDVNQATLSLLQTKDKQVLLAGLPRVLADSELKVLREEMITMAEGGQEFESNEEIHRTSTGDQRLVTVRTSVAPGYEHSLGKVLVSLVDMTAHKRAEEALRESEERLRQIASSLREVVWLRDVQTRQVLYVNPAFQELTGRTCESFYENRDTMIDTIHPDDREWVIKALDQRFESVPFDREHRIIHLDGSVRWVSSRIFPVRNEAGEVYRWASIMEDITERKQAEEEIHRLNQVLEQRVVERTAQLEFANKELEAFAYSVSHDLRAPLRHVDGFIEMLQKRTKNTLDHQSQHYMDVIAESANKMGTLIDDLLSFSRMGRNEMVRSQVDLNEVVREVIHDARHETEGRDIQWKIASLPPVTGDRAMLRIVLVNLISNALKFTRTRTTTEIEIGYERKETEIVIFVRDNGVGFDMDYVDKLFGVFQRLHRADEFEGTGIGLANVRRVISRHGGRTWAESEIDHGATIYFSLPNRPTM
ncbi:MAG: PAS domain S-box protein, partial [Chloroflexota bacterium]